MKSSYLQQLDMPQANQAQVWLCRLNGSADRVEEFSSLLSQEELERAGHFIVEQAKNRFSVSRGVLRSLLSGYLARPASEIDIIVDLLGKPRVGGTTLKFNVAHSGEWLIAAFADVIEVGIDIELHRPVKHWSGITESHFSPIERLAIPPNDSEQPPDLFFQIWTRKEAILKWHGTGLRTPLASFDVPTEEQCSEWVELPTVQKRCWVKSLSAPAGYSAALATSQPSPEVLVRELI